MDFSINLNLRHLSKLPSRTQSLVLHVFYTLPNQFVTEKKTNIEGIFKVQNYVRWNSQFAELTDT